MYKVALSTEKFNIVVTLYMFILQPQLSLLYIKLSASVNTEMYIHTSGEFVNSVLAGAQLVCVNTHVPQIHVQDADYTRDHSSRH